MAYQPSTICPVCQGFEPEFTRKHLVGAALIGHLIGGLAAAMWALAVFEKWRGWQHQFGIIGEPPVVAEARATALIIGLLVFTVVSLGATALVVRDTGRRVVRRN